MRECDLVIVGGGPAGLCAAINGASEGLDVCVLDAGRAFGGQARESAAIENYPMPIRETTAVTGRDLVAGFTAQARKFSADMQCPLMAVGLHADGDRLVTECDDGSSFASRAVILSLGLKYRRHGARGAAALMGRGVFYGMPSADPKAFTGKTVAIVGGANSAGQAALHAASNPRAKVLLLSRSPLAKGMSTYLIERVRRARNIEVREDCEVSAAEGGHWLEAVTLSNGDVLPCHYLCIFIGAAPRTHWLGGVLDLCPHGYIKEGARPFETSLPGVFVAGDVRSGSVKRISAAIGEGSAALQMVHRHLN